MDSLIGKVVDNYKILSVLGKGGMGVVFKAVDMNLEKNVALKMIDPFLARDENFLTRFKTEAKALAKLENPNIVSVFALRETKVGFFMVMEYVQGKTIADWLKEKRIFDMGEIVSILKQLLNAIGHAHNVGVIHRDIKPSNILLCEDGTIKVMDFGLAKVVQDHGAQVTMTQTAIGTLYYMSPEQIKGLKNVDTRSDIYSIGMSIYEITARRVPFDKSESEFGIQKQIVDGKIPSPSKYNPDIPRSLEKVIIKSINPDPGKRYQNAEEMTAALDGIDIVESPTAERTRRTIAATQQIVREEPGKRSGSKLLLILAPVVLVLFAIVYFVFLNNGGNEFNNSSNIGQTKEIVTPKIVYANLSVTSDPPGATVLIDNIYSGTTPFNNDSLKENYYSITVKKAGFKDWSNGKYQIKSGNNSLDVRLEPLNVALKRDAALILNIQPMGSIYVDGDLVSFDSNNPTRTNVIAGSHNIKFVSKQFGNKEINVDLKNKESRQLTCYFRKQINIQSLNENGDAIWGVIYINGEKTEKTTPTDMMLGPGTYQISLKKNGYETKEQVITVTIEPSFQQTSESFVFHLKKL